MTIAADLTDLYRTARRMWMHKLHVVEGLPYADAEDVYQDAFISAWRAVQQGRCYAVTNSWLARIIRNKVLDAHRSSAIRREAFVAGKLGVVSEKSVDATGVSEMVVDELRQRIRVQARARHRDGCGVMRVLDAKLADPDVMVTDLAREWGMNPCTAQTYRHRMRQDSENWRGAVTQRDEHV